ncbi:hypothetical protein K9N68_39030 (plasmid) [Kovacikia minuta CCNUW1]|uniref:hypothetical protein n=1 Tax=Kovacikia minuta TaxID=2931930 RepID=UPI001CC8FC76|nr:hypothetical protein [Kovacikia minuta]UBF30140.1 hypothetical protein K9N68_39030 [Kovacikia minuta CCNUW1]
MRQIEQLELLLWDMLQVAAIAPDTADLWQLLKALDESLPELDTVGQLQVAAEAIAQIVQVFQERSALAFEELEAANSSDGPIMPTDAFDRYVRQTMELDFEQFVEPLADLPRKVPERKPLPDEPGSVVGELDRVALLQALDEQMNEHPKWTEAEAFDQVVNIAHDEDISAWVEMITQWMGDHSTSMVPLMQLQKTLGMPLVKLWLALLLGGFSIEQHGAFYDAEQIWVLASID